MGSRYEVQGAGPNLLFLHGWGASYQVYKPLLDHLANRYTVAALDMPGAGGTPEPERPWELEDYIRFIRAFLSRLGWREAVLAGHSHGGRVIIGLLSEDNPDFHCPKAVIMAGACLRKKRGPRYYTKVYTYKAAKAVLSPFPAALEKYRQKKGSADYRAASPVMRGTLSNLVAVDQSKLLPKIKTPTLLLWGDSDTATPLWIGRKMERLMPDAGLVTMPGSHYAVMEQLPYAKRILDSFLNGR
jgi:pimeloyl-ACP methyl ester carboxylesterase